MSTRHFGLSSGAGRDPAPLWLAATPLAFFLPANASQSVAARFPAIESLDPAGRQGMRPGHLHRAPSHSLLMGGGMALDKPGRTQSKSVNAQADARDGWLVDGVEKARSQVGCWRLRHEDQQRRRSAPATDTNSLATA